MIPCKLQLSAPMYAGLRQRTDVGYHVMAADAPGLVCAISMLINPTERTDVGSSSGVDKHGNGAHKTRCISSHDMVNKSWCAGARKQRSARSQTKPGSMFS